MSGSRRPDRFRPGELTGSADMAGAESSPADQAMLLATARELEWLAAGDDLAPTADFADRVMAAIATEPAPRPVAAAIGAARRGRPAAILASLGDLWRVAWSGGRPLAVRAPAMALVLLLLVGSVGLGSLGAAAAFGLLDRHEPAPTVEPATPTVEPTTRSTETASPSPSPTASESPEPSESAEPSEASESAEPGGSDSTESPQETTRPATPRPTARPTPRPTTSHEPQATPPPTRTPRPSPTPTPRPTEAHGD